VRWAGGGPEPPCRYGAPPCVVCGQCTCVGWWCPTHTECRAYLRGAAALAGLIAMAEAIRGKDNCEGCGSYRAEYQRYCPECAEWGP
jgi:hypothetical protein